LIHEAAYFIHTTAIFVRWIADNEKEFNKFEFQPNIFFPIYSSCSSMQLFYGNGDLGFFTNNLNIFCWALLEFIWKIFKIILIFRSIQYLRVHQSSNSKNENQTLVIILNKQFHV
jgi:hypothetical protein